MIGAASYRTEQGDSDAQLFEIRALGHWKGNTCLKCSRTFNA